MSRDDDSQQPAELVPQEAAPTPASEAPVQPVVDPDAPLFDTPQLDVSLREAEHGHEHRDDS